ncbi:MAG TPA: hypothetical protein VKD70_15080 [Candidatus Acidoferrum sp.]|nr:hypothetical protein [Candidatus Acidoferrum sp.]
MSLLDKIVEGRIDPVFVFLAEATPQPSLTPTVSHLCDGPPDVSAIKYLLSKGATLAPLGSDLGLNGASFHGPN